MVEEFKSLLEITVNEIKRDNMQSKILKIKGTHPEDAAEIIAAYMESAVKRFEKFVTLFKTNHSFRDNISLFILDSLKAE